MKKHLMLFTAMLFLFATVYGQTDQKPSMKNESNTYGMFFQAGPAFPLMDLDNGDPTNSSSGMAAIGYHVEIGYTHQVTNNLGFKVTSFYFGNAYDAKKFNSYYENMEGMSYAAGSSQGWSVAGLLFKPYFYTPINDDITWEVYVTGGLSAFYTPKYQIARKTVYPASTTAYYYRDRSKGVSFAYGLGTQLNFKLYNTHFFASADFLYDPIKYKATGTDYNDQPYTTELKSKLGYFSANLGYIVYF